jgi:pilus assembly protein FimV
MFRRLSLALAIAAALAPTAAYPLGLGEIHPKSYLNQAFSADIDLLSVDPEELDTVKVELASADVFDRAGIPRPFFLSKLKFEPVAIPNGKSIIRVSSRESIREPFLNFLIEVNWPKGRAVKEYTVLLDPPVVSQRRPKPVAAPSVASTSAAKPAAPPATAPAAAVTGALEYGPTKPNDTLWSIAKGMGVGGASVEQVVMALYRYNPDAFIGNNINRLKVGEVLRLPGAEAATEQSRSEARAEFLEQIEAWRAESQAATAPAEVEKTEEESTPIPLQEPDAVAEAPAPAPEAPQLSEPELKLLGTDQETAPAAPEGIPGEAESDPEAGPEVASLDQALLLAREETAVARQEATEMRERIGELEDQLGEMQRLMTVQNDRLAQLQDQAEEAAKQPELAAPPPAPQGLMERLRNGDSIVLGLLGALGVSLLGLTALLVRGRKRETAAFAASTAPRPQPESSASEPASAGGYGTQSAAFAATAAAVASSADTDAPASESAPAEAEEPALDPLAEVDVYIAYGRYEQAEGMLKEEILRHPERLDYQHKLLEVYAEAGNDEAFVAQAEKMSKAGAKDQDPQAWSRVVEMGRVLAPGAALFGGAAAAAEAAGGEPTPEPEAETNFDFDLDFDLAGAGEPGAAPAAEAPERSVAENLDFELDDFNLEAERQAEPEVAQPEPASSVEAPESEPLEEEVEGLSLDEVGGVLEVPPPPREEPEEPEELVLDTDAFAGAGPEGVDQEEVETKIDLALAYQDMGDPDDARVILEEVLREGNEDQQQRARELLQALS